MFHVLRRKIAAQIGHFIEQQFGAAAPALEDPKQTSFGELSLPVFQLAKLLRKNPRQIASDLATGLAGLEGVETLDIAGNGYLNIRLRRGDFAASVLNASGAEERFLQGKIIVEHTNINPNKAAHIGHLRNAILGDTFVAMLRAAGNNVEVQNYIDNTGVQVADVVAGFLFLHPKSQSEIEAMIASTRFDYECWNLYAEVSALYAADPALQKDWRSKTLHGIEHHQPEIFQLAMLISDAIVACHLRTMARLGIRYDVLPRESEIIALKFWEKAFVQLKERGAIVKEDSGKNAGCWVMRGEAFSSDTGDPDDKVIVRSNNTVTYVGKDIAYQLWKFGLLGEDFFYRQFFAFDLLPVYVSTAEYAQAAPVSFGCGTRVYNVIDSRQSYLQDVVVAGLRALGYTGQAENSVHFSYEMVALSPRTCVELGIPLSEEDQRRPYVEVSGRKGLGVKADDLIDKLIENALREVESRHPDDPAAERLQVAAQIAVGALRYFMLKFTRNSVIAFDFQEALSFEGETGPYVQYAAVRARNILRKLTDRGESLPDFSRVLNGEALSRQLQADAFWQMLLLASKADLAIERALSSGEPAHVAKYAFQLAQAYNTFYHDYPVLSEQDQEKKAFLLWMTSYFGSQLERTLHVLGIAVPIYM